MRGHMGLSRRGCPPTQMENSAMTDDLPPETPIPVSLRVNGRDHVLALDPRTTLLDALR